MKNNLFLVFGWFVTMLMYLEYYRKGEVDLQLMAVKGVPALLITIAFTIVLIVLSKKALSKTSN